MKLAEMHTLNTQLAANEVTYKVLHDEMLASVELIKTLAEQNAQLVQAVEMNHKRLMKLTFITIIVIICIMITKH